MKTIALSVTEGRVIRDWFYNGMLEMLHDRGLDVLIISPATRVPQFVKTWSMPGVHFANLIPYELTRNERRLLSIRTRMMRLGKNVLEKWMPLERRLLRQNPEFIPLLKEYQCVLSVITHTMVCSEMQVYLAAKALGVTTLGILRSWDNLYKGLSIRPDSLVVWGPVNRQEAMDLMKVRPENISVLGSCGFDAYYAKDSSWSREKFCQELNLDPNRPIITLATLGSFLPLYDETYLVNLLLDAIQDGRISGHPQLVIRLHPASKLEYFSMYQGCPDVRISYMKSYIPTLGWTMNRDEVVFMANLLRHSNVVVSPGSTITIETAIFDTPTVVPIFHSYQPELAKEQYDQHLSRHFKRLADKDLVPIIKDSGKLIEEINHCFADPSWYRSERAQLVKDYIYFTDGRSTERHADLIAELATQGQKILQAKK